MRNFPCACDFQSFGRCVCYEIVSIRFGARVTFLDWLNAVSRIFSTEKVIYRFGELGRAHASCNFLNDFTKNHISELLSRHNVLMSLAQKGTLKRSQYHALVHFAGRFFAHIVSEKDFCVECLTPKEVLKIYRKLVFSKGGGLAQPLIIYREQL